ncbi:hypothetical protein [Hymenobacter sp. APR13]|uniref:hypothetical protein n=1 Tax=Hymenobacter sp. APR13 TaxID=1356852 RepID=UPI0004E0750B|nr:hypothetical protein [Hymenobacter sp. APR13]AII51028.1 hypothetical protein N008_03395 [Hymenobacter sp. APR13]
MKLLYLPLLLLPLAGYSQSTKLEISLAQQVLPAAGSAFHFDKLVDARPDRTSIGSVHRGLDNHLVPATLGGSLETELTPMLRQALPAGPATRPLVVRIYTLAVHETITAMSETGSAEVEMDFLEATGPDTYRLLLSVSELVEGKGLDVTSKHPDNIRRALQQGLQRLAAAVPPASAPTLTWAQVLAGEEGALPRFPVQTQPLQRGIYRSFEEFRQNAPTLTAGPFELQRKTRKGAQWAGTEEVEAWYLHLSDDQPRRLVRGAWGLSDGQNAYIFFQGRYLPLQAADKYYSFTGHRQPDLNNVVAGAVVGGLMGAALATSGTNQPQAYELRLASGRVATSLQPVGADGFAAAADTAAIYLYRRADAGPAAPLRVLVDGKEAGQLGPGQYLAFSWRDKRRDMAICVQGEQEKCHTFMPLFGTATFLACAPGDGAVAPTVQPVAAKEGLFQLKHIKAREKRPVN